MHNIVIREFFPEESADDKNRFLSAFLEIWNADENLKYLSFTLQPFSRDIIQARVDSRKEVEIRQFCAVNKDNEILGIATIKVNPLEGLEIYGIGVRLEHQKQGIGHRLIEHTIGLAKQLEYKAIDVVVFADNSTMLRLLLSHGFIPIGMEYHKKADGMDLVVMKLYL